MTFVHSRGEQWSQGVLWARPAFDTHGIDLDWFEKRIGPYLPTCDDLGVFPVSGRLGCSGAGKRRIFAIGNYINQRLLYPLHKWLMTQLRQLPMDGTFHQTAPLELLKGESKCFSFYLWPQILLFETIQALFDRSFASSAVNS